MMDIMVTVASIVAAVATVFLLPILSYLIIRRDQKIDQAEKKLHDQELALVRLEGEHKVLKVFADLVRTNVTRNEFEAAMNGVKVALEDIKDRLDRIERS